MGRRLSDAARLVSTWWGQVAPSVAVNFGFQDWVLLDFVKRASDLCCRLV